MMEYESGFAERGTKSLSKAGTFTEGSSSYRFVWAAMPGMTDPDILARAQDEQRWYYEGRDRKDLK